MISEASAPVEVAVGGIVVVDGHLLLVERGRPPAEGQWSIPGGRVEAGETLGRAVEREIAEETGLVVACDRFVGWVERVSPDHHFLIMDFEARVAPDAGRRLPALRPGDDARRAAWVALVDIQHFDVVGGLVEFLTEHGIL